MDTFLVSFIIYWSSLLVICLTMPTTLRSIARFVLPAMGLATMAGVLHQTSAPEKLLLSTLGLLYLMKAIILLEIRREDLRTFDKPGLLLYMTLWPGMNPEPFRRRTSPSESGARFVKGFCFMVAGLLLAVSLSLLHSHLPPAMVQWLGLASLLLIIHLGYADILSSFVRIAGWDVEPLFNDPFKSRSLADFWSKRWNVAFVDMDKILFMKPLKHLTTATNAGVVVYLISGVLHELAISYPAQAGWGGPFIYFAIQAAAYWIERRLLHIKKRNMLFQILWTWICIVGPLPLLFTAPFQQAFIAPLFCTLHDLTALVSIRQLFDMALYAAAVGNFLTIAAGLQVPWRLGWKEDLQQLHPFTQKIFWNYYGYIGLMIFSWGTLTLFLHAELLTGEKTALCLATLMGTFWGIRVLVDALYFKHRDWPRGVAMVIGHTLLTTLFCSLTVVYFGLVIWHCIA